MKDFTKLNPTYRARLDFPDSSFISHKTFTSYKECFDYAKKEAKKYNYCGFCVVFDEVPVLEIPHLDFNCDGCDMVEAENSGCSKCREE